jgi:hypothetical protein
MGVGTVGILGNEAHRPWMGLADAPAAGYVLGPVQSKESLYR